MKEGQISTIRAAVPWDGSDECGRTSPRWCFFVLVVLSTATFLRFFHLGNESFWGDEIATVTHTNRASLEIVWKQPSRRPGARFGVYYTLCYLIQKLAGGDPMSLRILSAVAGSLSVLALYFLGSLILNRKAGLLAAALMATDAFPIYYSQEARMYSLVCLTVIVATCLFSRLLLDNLRGRPLSRMTAANYVLFSVLSVSLHYFAVLIVALHAATALVTAWMRPSLRKPLLCVSAVLVLGTLPIAPNLIEDLVVRKGLEWLSVPQPSELGDLFVTFLGGKGRWWVSLIAGTAGLAAYLLARGKGVTRIPGALLVALAVWAFGPILFAFAYSCLITPIWHPRYLIVALPAVYLLISSLIAPWVRSRTGFAALVALVLVGGVHHLFHVTRYYSEPQKIQLRAALEHIRKKDSNIPIAAVGNHKELQWTLKYLGDPRRIQWSWLSSRPEMLEGLVRSESPYVWLVGHSTFRSHIGQSPLKEALEAHFRAVHRAWFRGVKVYLLQRRSEDPHTS